MTVQTITMKLPEKLVKELDIANQEFLVEVLERGLQAIKIDRALELYVRGGMSFGAAAHFAGVSQSDLARHAYSKGLEPLYSPETLAEELS